MVHMPATNELDALREALADAVRRNEALSGELRVVRTERDLLQEKLNQITRRLFAAQSEAGTSEGFVLQRGRRTGGKVRAAQ